jgi:glutaredoxin
VTEPASPEARHAGDLSQEGPNDARSVVAVTVLTQSDCGLCEDAKEVLQRVGHDPQLSVRLSVAEIPLGSEHGRKLAVEAGVLFAPGILLNSQPFSHGRLSERKLRRTLARLGERVT